MERELKNGHRYFFNEIWEGYIKAFCLFGERWNPLTVTFKSWEEVDKWCEKMDYDYTHPQEWKPSAPPSNYYDDNSRYYGD